MSKIGDSVISSYFRTVGKPTGKDVKMLGAKVYVGQVERVHFTDDATNVSKQFVEYDVSVRDENGGQTIYKNVRAEGPLGGSNDFSEIILEPNEFPFRGKLNTSNIFSNKNGTLVYLAFRDNSLDKPYIEGCVDHPRAPSAVRSDGIRYLAQFRGVEFNINKEGELIITYNGGKSADGSNPRASTAPTTVKIDQNGDFSITNNKNHQFTISRNDSKITISVPNNTFEIDQTAGTITSTNANGKIFKLDTHQTLGQGSEPIVLGDTLFNMLDTFLSSVISGIVPGTPGQNAASLISIKNAATTLQGVLANFKSTNSRTD